MHLAKGIIVFSQIRPTQAAGHFGQFLYLYICILIFYKEAFKTIPDLLEALFQLLALKSHAF